MIGENGGADDEVGVFGVELLDSKDALSCSFVEEKKVQST